MRGGRLASPSCFLLHDGSRSVFNSVTFKLNFTIDSRSTTAFYRFFRIITVVGYIGIAVCMVAHIARVWINQVRLPVLFVVS